MQLDTHFSALRESHVGELNKYWASLQGVKTTVLLQKLWLRSERRPYRDDAVVILPTSISAPELKYVRYAVDQAPIALETCTEAVLGIKVRADNFRWSSVHVDVRGWNLEQDVFVDTVIGWFHRWLKPSDDDTADEVMHALSKITLHEEMLSFVADLGTAPAACLTDLLKIFAGCCSEVHLYSRDDRFFDAKDDEVYARQPGDKWTLVEEVHGSVEDATPPIATPEPEPYTVETSNQKVGLIDFLTAIRKSSTDDFVALGLQHEVPSKLGQWEVVMGLREVSAAANLGCPRLPYRADLVCDDKTVELELQTKFSFEPANLAGFDCAATLSPFAWSAVSLTCTSSFTGNPQPLWDWYTRWFREEAAGSSALIGALHSISNFERVEGAFRFSVDFGSAPVDAFMDLLRVLNKELNATHFAVTSSPPALPLAPFKKPKSGGSFLHKLPIVGSLFR
jgi:hypothetical protein